MCNHGLYKCFSGVTNLVGVLSDMLRKFNKGLSEFSVLNGSFGRQVIRCHQVSGNYT